ncbi:MAG: response regulator transcription factor [Bacteroidota bacterium]|nr:response regulator transcription factor [Bacteroidota bacterium]
MSKVKVLIVEDEAIIAENIALYLDNNDFTVSGIAYDDEDALHELKCNTPDTVILDINLNSAKDGIALAECINTQYQLPFLFLTSYSDKETLQRAKAVEPSGYIVKPFHEKTLLSSLEIALSNHASRSNQRMAPLNFEIINKKLLSPLSEREAEVLQLVYEGKTNNQIAAELFKSENTIKVHLKNAYLKLDADSRTTALARLRKLMMK